MKRFNAWRRVLAATAALTLLLGVSAAPRVVSVDETLAAQTDRVQFGADFQTSNPLTVTGQWSRASVTTRTGAHELDSRYSTEPRAGQTVVRNGTTLCVDGGADPQCFPASTDRSAASTQGTPETVVWNDLLRPEVTIKAFEDIKTGARCWADEDGNVQLEARRPTGIIRTSGVNLLFPTEHDLDVTSVNAGETAVGDYSFGVNLGILGLLAAYAKVEVTPRWGAEAVNNTAFSEVQVRYQVSTTVLDVLGVVGVGDNASPLISYTVRSECGLTSNDGTGSTEPAPEAQLADGLVAVADALYPFLLDSERELDAGETELVEEALGEVADEPTGELPGVSWDVTPAEEADSPVPEVALELDDGTAITATPDVPGADDTDEEP